MSARKIAISCGDPSGLGPELIGRCLQEAKFDGCEFQIFGDRPWLESNGDWGGNSVKAVALCDEAFKPGQPTPRGAVLAIEAMQAAADACGRGDCDAVVTGPISKSLCVKEGFEFPGQTEFFAARWGGEPTMAFVGKHLRICLATWHIPLSEVSRNLSEQTFRRSVFAAVSLGQRLGVALPRVMVCGLNPHAGEDGLLGSEEKDRLNPWLERLRSERVDGELIGCVPGDTAFERAMRGDADVVVALYHDQGLAPFKTVDFASGVNVTLGLPHLRVSPDHGTGFELAGKGAANHGSMRHAIELAIRLGKA